MGNGKLFSKKSGNVRVFRLVNRSVMGDTAEVDEHGNPLPDRVFAEVTPEGGEDDFEDIEEEDEGEYVDVGDEQEVDQQMIAERAGEAAKYGILFDDRHYDYTQHLKPIGKVPGGVFVAATATTIDHQAKAVDPMTVEAAETRLNHATYDHLKATPDVDPAVLQALEALEDDAFVDEDAFEDDFIVKLDREETSIMASLDQLNGQQRSRLDKDFANILRMYDEDGEGFEIEESYEEDEDVDVEGYENFSEASGPEGDEKGGNNWHQLDEVRRELAEGDPKLLERILYTSDDDEEEEAGNKKAKKKQLYQIIDVDADDVNRKELNCQTAIDWMPNRNTFKPKIIRAANPSGAAPVEPIRISRKTGMPLESLDKAIPIPKDEISEEDEEKINKGEARKKDETAEEKRARKAAVKLEKKEKRISKKEAAVLQSRISA